MRHADSSRPPLLTPGPSSVSWVRRAGTRAARSGLVIGAELSLLLVGCANSSPAAESAPRDPAAESATTEPTPKDEHSAATPSLESAPSTNGASDAVSAAVTAPDRSEADRALDAGRRPAETLRFFGIRPGMRVAELAAGGGYTAELLARVVGAQGKVYGQNTPFILDRFAEEPWSARLAKGVMSNVIRVDTELEAPLPEPARDLDAVLMVLFYHDTVWFETDRAAMNRAVFQALKPGGVFGIVDHAARPGDGVKEAKRLHRIEESVVVTEVEAAGFVLEERADFLRNPKDERDWSASPSQAGERRGQSDRFVLRFVKE